MLRTGRGPKSLRRNRKSNLSGVQGFEVEDVTIEITPTQTPTSPIELNELKLNLPGPSKESTPCPSISGAVDSQNPFPESINNAFLPLKLAADLIPRFDGNVCLLIKFIRQCQLAESRVKPVDRINLLALIRNKIEGQADLLIANRQEPKSLKELISLLKTVFARTFDVDMILDELKGLHQGVSETVEIYGARASEILNRGLEAAKERFNSEQFTGTMALLNHAAVKEFIRGLQSQILRLFIVKERTDNLEEVINIASKLEQETSERPKQFLISASNSRDAKVLAAGADERRCYKCDRIGHLTYDCPEIIQGRGHPSMSTRDKIRCNFCKKTGHIESRCFRKQNQNDLQIPNKNVPTSKASPNLNFKGTSRKSATWSDPLIASARSDKPVSN